MIDRRSFALSLGALFMVPAAGRAEPGVVDPKAAQRAVDAGDMVLIDIRTPEEWQQTGVARGAWPIDMRRRDFGPILMAVRDRNPGRRVAVICRTGNRSGRLVELLRENGITDVLDVSEGMVGGRYGPGWLKAGLPTVTAQQALAGIPRDLTVK